MEDSVIKSVLEQMFLNKNMNYKFDDFPENLNISNDLERQLLEPESGLVNEIIAMDHESIEKLCDYMCNKCLKLFFYNNQYLNFDISARACLKDTYKKLISRTKTLILEEDMTLEILRDFIRCHHLELSHIVHYYNENEMMLISSSERYLTPKVCSEYSALFQLRLLGLEEDKLLEPILDIGCGSDANLVRYLRQAGFEAYGIERQIENKSEHVDEANWLTYNMGQDKWGTIISNMAFSNHYFHQEIAKNDQVELYKNKYYEILNSLKQNGSFIYAPGLPTIEDTLDDRYKVEKIVVQGVSDARLYATKIRKL